MWIVSSYYCPLFKNWQNGMNILIINAGQEFEGSGGAFNKALTVETVETLSRLEANIKVTHIEDGYDVDREVRRFVWADYIIYHTPIWWFQVPYEFKKYIDEVFSTGHRVGIYQSDGRSSKNPAIDYGTGGSLMGTKYMLTTSWNAPETAFTLPGEFFNQTSVDDGPMSGFHNMNAFVAMQRLTGFHFYDVEKNDNIEKARSDYRAHLLELFQNEIKEGSFSI
jgi:modulator of drug activity B